MHFDRSGPTLTVALDGALDIHLAPGFTDQVLDQLDATVAHVIVDLSKLTFCDLSGLEAIAALDRHAQDRGAELRLYRPRPPFRELIEATGFAELLPLTG